MDKVNKEACIQLHKLIESGDEQGAINLINSVEGIDVNYKYNTRYPIFSALYEKMHNLFKVIVTHPTFDQTIEDGFGERILGCFLYLYGASNSTEDDKKELKPLIDTILNMENYDFNYTDINGDTVLITSCEYTELNWVTENLLNKKGIDLNIINDYENTALTAAIRYKNIEAIKMLSKMEGLVVRDIDREAAKKVNIDLSEYGL